VPSRSVTTAEGESVTVMLTPEPSLATAEAEGGKSPLPVQNWLAFETRKLKECELPFAS
jgi:hypothetical protein